MADQPADNTPAFDPAAAHQATPKLRPVRAFPMPVKLPNGEDQVMLGLADARQISPKIVGAEPAFQAVIARLDGKHSIEGILEEVGRGLTQEMLERFIAQLDDAALLEGPIFDALLDKVRSDFDASDILPPGATVQFADALVMQALGEDATDEQKAEQGPAKLAEAFDKWIDQALEKVDNPAFDELPKAVVAPHIDYPRGWMNYAAVWGRMRVVERPDRVVILGTNHFGMCSGVCGCDKGYETPLGVSPVDSSLIDALRSKLGDDADKLFEHRYDHENEHSIELQIPWIQHVLGPDESGVHLPVFGVLIHDPAANNGESYDDQGLGLETFVEALRAALAEVGGTTLFVSSADLSHVGPAFGDQQNVGAQDEPAEAFRQKTIKHDQDMLKILTERRIDDLVSSMAWQQNPTRWCSVGNLVATIKLADPESVEVLAYAAAIDPQGATMVSSAAMVMK